MYIKKTVVLTDNEFNAFSAGLNAVTSKANDATIRFGLEHPDDAMLFLEIFNSMKKHFNNATYEDFIDALTAPAADNALNAVIEVEHSIPADAVTIVASEEMSLPSFDKNDPQYVKLLKRKYVDMMRRAYDKKFKSYQPETTVCDEWRTDFSAFFNWGIKNGFKEDPTLRLNKLSSSNVFSPETCRLQPKAICRTEKISMTADSGNSVVFDFKEDAVAFISSKTGEDPKKVNKMLTKALLTKKHNNVYGYTWKALLGSYK